MLAEIYRFTEGFDTADLKDAEGCSRSWRHEKFRIDHFLEE
jgi:hypothetical protein